MGILKRMFNPKQKKDTKHFENKVSQKETISKVKAVNLLKQFRKDIAKREKMRPYFVFTNQTLNYILERPPKSKEEFLQIYGLGEKRYIMYGEELISLFKDKVIVEAKKPKITNKEIIFEKIRKERNQYAKELGILPFQIFSNKTIEDLVDKLPYSKDELYDVYGFGEIKIQKYGDWILSLIKSCLENQVVIDNDKKNINAYTLLYNQLINIFCSDEYINRKIVTKLQSEFSSEITTVFQYEYIPSFAFELNEIQWRWMRETLFDIEQLVKEKNQSFVEYKLIKEQNYLDNILKKLDSNINLDLNQRICILNDEDYSLVLAGAGAGKTTTISAKVKYLVEKKNIDPNQILIISYTNKAVRELKERINKVLKIPCEISTFHKVGLNIVKTHHDTEKLKIVHDGLMYKLVRDYLTKKIVKYADELKELILFFGYYIDMPTPELKFDQFLIYQQSQDFTTMKEEIQQINQELIQKKKRNKRTIKNEIMRSIEEVQIANFLYLHGIEYEYEEAYPYHISNTSKLYTPDFSIKVGDRTIYIEHFGIHENGTHNRYSDEELKKYKAAIKNKIELHEMHGTELITTYSKYKDGKSLIEHLREELIKKQIPMHERDAQEVFQEIVKGENNKYFNKFILLINNFISNFKRNGYSENDFDVLYNRVSNVRARMFLKLCKPIYLYYQAFLTENGYTDFEDMINNSTKIIQNARKEDFKNKYHYIFVDEYQDISRQRFNLTKELAEKTDAKIVAVGDDWQSIYAFAGSQITLFTKFKEEMGYADYLTIDYTYRNAQEIIDVAGAFIQKNKSQLRKHLKSPKHIKKPFVFYEYNDFNLKDKKKGIKGVTQEKAEKLDEIIGKIVQVEGEYAEILLLVRYNFEINKLTTYSDLFFETKIGGIRSVNYPKTNITILTVHKAKGLGFDNVILLNGSDEFFGFPSQIEMDPILSMVVYDDKSYQYAEERRLFYVALTRTKKRVFILYPKSKPSAFIREMVEDYEDITLHGEILDKKTNRKATKCPICGYPLQFKDNKSYGLKLYMCTNEVELCGFMTNNLRGGKTSIQKCDKCKDGFLIVKPKYKEDEVFLGCTNYTSDRRGCNNTKNISLD